MRRHAARHLRCESLEDRQMMATLVTPTILTYQDIDGDDVTVKFSKPILTSQAQANAIFDFAVGSVNNSNAQKQQLRGIDLGSLAAAAGTTISLTAAANNTQGGDGFAALGRILANLDLGAVTIDGDLGRVDAGDSNPATTGLGGLTVQSLGRFGLTTGGGGLSSTVDGRLTRLTVKGDIHGASVFVQGSANGSIGPVSIAGSLIGDGIESGRIVASGEIGAVSIDGDVQGGAGGNSGSIESQGKIASLRIGGSLGGGDGAKSGTISSFGGIGPVTIRGSIVGGSGTESGYLYSEYAVSSIKVGGSLIGGDGVESGKVEFRKGVGGVTITGNLKGGAGYSSGTMSVSGESGPLTVGGSLLGGDGSRSGTIQLGATLRGNSRINGDLIGGGGTSSGAIFGTGIDNLIIGGSIRGGTASESGSVDGSRIKNLSIGGDLIGGNASGIQDLEGAGRISAYSIANLTVGGSIVAGTDATSGNFEDNGAIRVSYELTNLTVKGSLLGNATHRVLITAARNLAPSLTSDLAIGTMKINGRVERTRIRAGLFFELGGENADAQIGSATVGGNWIASSITAGASSGADGQIGTADDAKLSGMFVKDIATIHSKINSITIVGQVLGTAGGSDHFGFVAETLGSLKIGGANIPLLAGNSNDNKPLGITGDVRAREV